VDLDTYIERNRLEWGRLEELARGSRPRQRESGKQVSELVRLYLRASSHLAEVQSRYHDPGLESYLNALVSKAHTTIYATETRSWRSTVGMFGARYREAISRTVPHILVVAGVLGVLIVATDLWIANSSEAELGLLPPAAREAARQTGTDPLAGDIPPAAFSGLILQNNVQVAFLAFAFGITFGVGTLFVVVQNALFIGQIAGAFHAAGNAASFWAVVLPHGFLELIAICIAGGAGLRIGWAMIDPGDRPRLAALGEEARDAVLVVVGVIPAFVIAAAIEGFVTARTGFPYLEVALGAVVAAGYLAFLLFPRRAGPTGAPAP
jgi:uncharacterized membrane protein SpoIIM required for sporulation